MTILTGARVVTPTGVLPSGWVRVDGERITDVGATAPPDDGDLVGLNDKWLVPGFIDLHVHGGGGAWATSRDPAEVRRAVQFHCGHGTTRTLLSVATASAPEMIAAAGTIADLVDEGATSDGHVVGVHLEGPFLSGVRCGAQDPAWLVAPDPQLLDELIQAGRGSVRVVTLAPELPGGIEMIRQLTDYGVTPAMGHSDGSYADGAAAIDAGVRLATHLFNGMRPSHHRDPGLAGAALDDSRVICEIIADGAHLHESVIRFAVRAAGPSRIALITDAIAAAGAEDGLWPFGSRRIRVSDGVAELEDGSSLAGSILTMDVAFRRAVAAGVSVVDATAATSGVPARLLGMDGETGSIEAGKAADLVVLSPTFDVEAVMVAGRWVGEMA